MLLTLEDTGFTIEDAEIFYKNFEGREGRYNNEGERSFALAIPESAVEQMMEDGWNVRYTKNEDVDRRRAFITVNVGYKIRPPRVLIMAGENRQRLEESNIALLDWAEIEHVDVTVRARPWARGGDSGITGWLQEMYVTLQHSRLREKYGDEGL